MKILRVLLAGIVAWGAVAAVAAGGVPYATDLAKDAALARAHHTALLVVFVGKDCSYCETVLNDFLIPMSRNPEYQSKVLMRRVATSSNRDLKDFSGQDMTQQQFAGFNGVYLVPTVMLFDDKGNPLTKPLVGLTTVDYYGMFLDRAIDQALNKLRHGS
jgi:thioredoxin-related protein